MFNMGHNAGVVTSHFRFKYFSYYKQFNFRCKDTILRKKKLDFDRIKVNRTGDHFQSFMVTDEVLGTVEPRKRYGITINGLVLTDANISESFKQKGQVQTPANIQFHGAWITTDDGKATDANILGGSGTLQINQTELCIPQVVATDRPP